MNENIELLKIKISSRSKSEHEAMLLRNMFALGCFLHSIDKKAAAEKTLDSLFTHLEISEALPDIINELEGNEKQFSSKVNPHAEINNIFPSSQKTQGNAK